MAVLRVVELVGSALVQDGGRPGHRVSGVPSSGAFDRLAHAAATTLVAGSTSDATIEMVGRVVLRASHTTTCAVTGPVSVRVAGGQLPADTAFDLPAGAELELATDRRGYLAVAGGLRAEEVLGSRSTCVLSGLGPAPLRAGSTVPLADACWVPTAGDFWRPVAPTGPVRVVPGPHLTFRDTAVLVLDTSRIGVRVRAERTVTGRATLPSLGVLPGAIQVLPSGDWIVLGPDSGTMGGYPVVAVVASGDLDRWAQARAGDRLELGAVSARDAAPWEAPRIVGASRLSG